MEALKKVGAKLKLPKCRFAKGSVKYLVHILEKNVIRPAKDNLRAIREFEQPKAEKNNRHFRTSSKLTKRCSDRDASDADTW